MGLCMHSVDISMRRRGFALLMLALTVMLAACASTPLSPVAIPIKTPVATQAAGEAILPYSQILLHDAPLPLAADYHVDRNNWTLAGYDPAATRDVALPDCCSASPAPL